MASKILPVYRQIYLTIKNNIERGKYRHDKPLPSEFALAEQFGVSRVTLRRTLDLLEKEGLINRQPGLGTFLNGKDQRLRCNSSISNLFDTIRTSKDRYKVKVFENRIARTPSFLTNNNPSFGETSLQIRRVSRLKRDPVHISTQYFPTDLLKRLSQENLASSAVLLHLREAGIETARTDLVIAATLADIDSAKQLEIQPGMPLITTKRLSIDNDGNPLEFLDALTRPDQYEYVFRFEESVSFPVKATVLK